MEYTWDEMNMFYKVYLEKGSSRTIFVNKMINEYNVLREDATLIWQAFDMAIECNWDNLCKTIGEE